MSRYNCDCKYCKAKQVSPDAHLIEFATALSMSSIQRVIKEDADFSYCQRDIEGESKCEKQCDHCKTYYAPLENQPV